MKEARQRKCKTEKELNQMYGMLLRLTLLEELELPGSSREHRLITALKIDSYWSIF